MRCFWLRWGMWKEKAPKINGKIFKVHKAPNNRGCDPFVPFERYTCAFLLIFLLFLEVSLDTLIRCICIKSRRYVCMIWLFLTPWIQWPAIPLWTWDALSSFCFVDNSTTKKKGRFCLNLKMTLIPLGIEYNKYEISFVQYVPVKSIKHVMKSFDVCSSDTVMLLSIEIYIWKENKADDIRLESLYNS